MIPKTSLNLNPKTSFILLLIASKGSMTLLHFFPLFPLLQFFLGFSLLGHLVVLLGLLVVLLGLLVVLLGGLSRLSGLVGKELGGSV